MLFSQIRRQENIWRQEVDEKTLLWVVNKTPKCKGMKIYEIYIFNEYNGFFLICHSSFPNVPYIFSFPRGRLLLKMKIYNHACHYRMNLMLNWWRICFFNYKRISEYLYGTWRKICELYLWMNELIPILFCVSVPMRNFFLRRKYKINKFLVQIFFKTCFGQ